MDAAASHVLLFGDQTVEKLPGVRVLAQQANTCPVASRFLRAAADAIQTELRHLPADAQADVDDFDTILGLAEANATRAEPNETIATALMAVTRLGELIIQAQADPSLLGSGVAGGRAVVIGLCTGQLSASVAVAARDTSELFALAVETTRIVFRLGREVCHNSRCIDKSLDTWATTIVGLQVPHVQALLDTFHTETRVPRARQVAIGVEARSWLTLFGPPATLARLWEWSDELAQAPRIPTEARGGVHMATVPSIDTEWVLGTSPLLGTPLDAAKAVMHSTVDGTPLVAATFGELLRMVLPDIVHHPLRFHDTLDAAVRALPPGRPVRLTVLGPTGHTSFVQRALAERGLAATLAGRAVPLGHVLGAGQRGGSDAIAVVGMSGRFPGAADINSTDGVDGIEGYWRVLQQGQRCVAEIPPSRFDLDTYGHSSGQKPGSTLARHGVFLDKPGLFDHRLFNVSPREALQMDPVHRLLLTASYEALESAGYYPDATPATRSPRIATFMGQASDDHREILANEGVDIYYIPGMVRAFAPGRINYHFKWGGGAFAVDSACATSTTATALACRALLNRDCDTALAGAGSLLCSPWPFAGLSRGGFLSLGPGGCNTFHDDADGYVRGEGVGVVVLKRLEDALADNDNILGLISGVARNYSRDASSITHPSATDQTRLYHEVLHKTATDPASISYVEMHGTGTQAGDNVEMSSVLATFGRGRTKENPLVVGAVKANIGHGEAAAGVSSLIKILLMFRERCIPPQPGFPFKVNTKFPDLDALNVRIATNLSSLKPAADGKRRAFLNSFDAAGGNSCLLLEEAPAKQDKTNDPRPCHIIALSARTPASLLGNKQRLLNYLEQHPEVRLADVAYTTTARRMHSTLRTAFVVTSTADLMDRLTADVGKGLSKARATSANVVFTFTGQGAMYAGMGKHLWKHSLSFRREMESLQAFADLQSLPNFIHLIQQGDSDISTTSPAQSQLAIVALEIALARMFQALDVRPDVVIGHSLGEYAALCVAGVLSVSDTIYLVAKRAAMMEETLKAHEYAMLAVAEAESIVRGRLGSEKWKSCEIACLNAPTMTVVSGTVGDVESLQEELQTSGTRSTLLRVPYGFHSKQLEPILDTFEQCAQGVVFSKPSIPVASTLLGQVISETGSFSAKYLRRQAREPVAFIAALEACKTTKLIHDNTVFVEMGPEPICNGMVRATLSVPQNRLVASLNSKSDDWSVLSASLVALYTAGVAVKWPQYHRDFIKYLTLVDLPRYAFDEKEFWQPFRPAAAGIVGASATGPAAAVAGFPTSSLQHRKSTAQDGDVYTVIFESDPYEKDLYKAIRGHAVAGITICPSSIFCDMALTAAKVVYGALLPMAECPPFSVHDLAITRPLIVADKPRQQTIEVTATIPDSKTPTVCKVTFKVRDETGTHDTGGCSISYAGNTNVKKSLSRDIFFIRTRMESLQEKATRGFARRMFKPAVYQLFQNLVDYAPPYQGLEEVVMNGDFRDAVATVKLPVNPGRGNFMFNAHLLDAVVHLAGFFANCGLTYPEDIAFLFSTIEKWHLFEPLSVETMYTSYVYMEEQHGGSQLVGDVYVFNGDTLACVALGIQAHKMKKTTLAALFSAADPSARQHNKASLPAPTSFTSTPHSVTSTPPETVSLEADNGSGDVATAATSATKGEEASAVVDKLLAAVASESGVDVSEMTPDMAFADLGIDSLMAIVIIAAVRNSTGVELPGSFFLDHVTVGEATAALGGKTVSGDSDGEESEDEEDDEDEEEEDKSENEEEHVLQTDESKPAPVVESSAIQSSAKVILLQGSPSSTETPVFILADATGTVSSYTILPALPTGRKLYGIESPFARQGIEHQCSVEAMATLYKKAIQETHPSGPYLLIGTSTSAVHAYEVCRQLASNILGLVLIDMAAPARSELADHVTLPLTPERLQHSGVFIGNPVTTRFANPMQLRSAHQHICATVHSLLAYRPSPLPASAKPQRGTVLITSSTGPVSAAANGSDESDVPLIRWARGQWDDDTDESKGWAALVGGPVDYYTVDVGHTDLFKFPKVREVGRLYAEVVLKMLA